MDLEETKKIIQNKIEAGEMTREVRSQIKSYIDQKQNLREGFKETFEPLIETQEAVKASIDTQQNKLIEQLQEKQLALTEGLNNNRLTITSGFDKMDEVKRWDLSQLPGLEAIEEESGSSEERELGTDAEQKYQISNKDLYYITGLEKYNKEGWEEITMNELRELEKEYAFLIQDKYQIEFIEDPELRLLKVKKIEEKAEKPSKRIIVFNDADLDSGLNNDAAAKILKNLGLPLPSDIKNENYRIIKYNQKKAEQNYIEMY